MDPNFRWHCAPNRNNYKKEIQDAMTPCSMVSKYPRITSGMNIKQCTDAFPEDSATTNQNMDLKMSKNTNHILTLPVTVEKIGNSYEIINITGLERHKIEHPNRQFTLNQLRSESWHSKTTLTVLLYSHKRFGAGGGVSNCTQKLACCSIWDRISSRG